jgi:hypothetical protein
MKLSVDCTVQPRPLVGIQGVGIFYVTTSGNLAFCFYVSLLYLSLASDEWIYLFRSLLYMSGMSNLSLTYIRENDRIKAYINTHNVISAVSNDLYANIYKYHSVTDLCYAPVDK